MPTSPPIAGCVAFELAYPDRFVECGIAEQDMVSTAAGLARHGGAARRQLVRVLPRVTGERADLQPGERADEGHLCTPLRGPDSGGTGEVPPVRARHLAACVRYPARSLCSREPRTRRARCCDGRSKRGTGNVAIRLAIGPSPRRIELAGELQVGWGAHGARRRRCDSPGIRAGHVARGAHGFRARRRTGPRPSGREHAVAESLR